MDGVRGKARIPVMALHRAIRSMLTGLAVILLGFPRYTNAFAPSRVAWRSTMPLVQATHFWRPRLEPAGVRQGAAFVPVLSKPGANFLLNPTAPPGLRRTCASCCDRLHALRTDVRFPKMHIWCAFSDAYRFIRNKCTCHVYSRCVSLQLFSLQPIESLQIAEPSILQSQGMLSAILLQGEQHLTRS